MEKAKNNEDGDLMILGESSSSSRLCVPLPPWELSPPFRCSSCFNAVAALNEAPPRPFVSLPRTIPEDSPAPQQPSTSFHLWKFCYGWYVADMVETDWSESKQLELFDEIPT